MFALLSAIAFAMSVQGGRWWAMEGVEVGPFGTRRCFSGSCSSTGLSWLGGSERWMRTGIATWAAGLLAVAVLVVIAGAIAAKRAPRLAAKLAVMTIATAAIAGGLFVAQFPSAYAPAAELARGVWLFIAAIVLGAVAAISVLRTKR